MLSFASAPREPIGARGALPCTAAFAVLVLLGVGAACTAAPASASMVAEALGDRVTRFDADSAARAAALPSLALQRPFAATGPAAPGLRVRPAFTQRMGSQVVSIATEAGTSLYGAGAAAGALERNGTSVLCWNSAANGEQSHPWVLAVRRDGSSFGVIADTPNRLVMDFTRGIELRSQGPAFPVLVIERASPQQVLEALAALIGTTPLPPRWALGFHASRASFASDSEVVRTARTFRAKRIPCDALWYGIDSRGQRRSFTWDPRSFADPVSLRSALGAAGYHSVATLEPGVRTAPGYVAFDRGERDSVWVEAANGAAFIGTARPGACVFPDFTRAAARACWAGLVAEFADRRLDGLWNDRNEPLVLDVPSQTMPETNRHEADAELGGPGPHTRYHNAYGMLMARASHEGLRRARPEQRPFVLSRANFIGGQRYAAARTSSQPATWESLRRSVPASLNLGLSGQAFSGPDLSGSDGRIEPALYARWMGVGALFPFARTHSEPGAQSREPWGFGPVAEATVRRAIETRYRLLPYLYSCFDEASRTGLPVMRPVFFCDPADPDLRSEQQSFLLGGDVLVEARLDASPPGEGPTVSARLSRKGAPWRRAEAHASAEAASDPDLPRLYLRPGAIVPLGPVMQFVDERPLDEIELLVSVDARGRAAGVLYEDAGDGYGYETGALLRTRFEASLAGTTLTVTVAGTEGTWPVPKGRRYRITPIGSGIQTVVGPPPSP